MHGGVRQKKQIVESLDWRKAPFTRVRFRVAVVTSPLHSQPRSLCKRLFTTVNYQPQMTLWSIQCESRGIAPECGLGAVSTVAARDQGRSI